MDTYYNTCPFAKPKTVKKKKKQNGWKDKPNRYCYYTGQAYAQRHEIFFGEKNRQISVDHGFQIDLHPAIHMLFHRIVDKHELEVLKVPGMFPDPIAWIEAEEKKFQQKFQTDYEEREQFELGLTEGQARENWKKLIGRNYLYD